MAQTEFLINTGTGYKKAGDPVNWKGMKLEALFTSGADTAPSKGNVYNFGKVKIGNLEWVAEEAAMLNKYRNDGLIGAGPGIYEAPGLKIRACGQNIFEGGIELGTKSVQWECDKVVAPLKEKGIESIMSLAESFDFNYLFSKGIIKPSDYKWIPYCVSAIPDGTHIVMAAFGIFIVTTELINMVREISERIEQMIFDLTPPTSLTTLEIVSDILTLIIYFLYVIGLILRLIQLINELLKNIIQSKKWKLGMRVKDLFEKAFEHLGYKFSSSIFASGSEFENVTIMPRKIVTPEISLINNPFHRPENEENLGTGGGSYGYYDGTFGKFLREMMELFNAEIVEQNGTILFEERNSFNNSDPYQIPNTDVNGYTHNLPDPHETNADEINFYYALFYSVDETDRNTLNKYRGTSCDVTLEPIITNDKKNWSVKNGKVITFPYAHARRKETLTKIEKFFDDLLNSVVGKTAAMILGPTMKALQKTINKIYAIKDPGKPKPSLNFNFDELTKMIENRIGWLLLSQDTSGVQKIFIGEKIINSFNPPGHLAANGEDWEIRSDSEATMSALNIMRKFHKKNLATRGNQCNVYKNRSIKFCCDDWIRTREKNVLITPDGKKGKFQRIEWDIHNDQAVIDYRIQQKHTNNLHEVVKEDGQPSSPPIIL